MKSPITGKEMKLTKERRSMDFRKETFEIVFHYYKCEDSEEQFTTTSMDEVNMNQVYNQYRDRFNIPFPDEIVRIREKYSLSAAKMSEILGFGVNSYRQYEAGEMPSIANSKLIQMAEDPKTFIGMIELCGTLDEKVKAKYIQKAQLLEEERKRNIFNLNFK
ncbi:MAG: type II TA system antitoxin MqsA family protein [Chitinophagales bacterium]